MASDMGALRDQTAVNIRERAGGRKQKGPPDATPPYPLLQLLEEVEDDTHFSGPDPLMLRPIVVNHTGHERAIRKDIPAPHRADKKRPLVDQYPRATRLKFGPRRYVDNHQDTPVRRSATSVRGRQPVQQPEDVVDHDQLARAASDGHYEPQVIRADVVMRMIRVAAVPSEVKHPYFLR